MNNMEPKVLTKTKTDIGLGSLFKNDSKISNNEVYTSLSHKESHPKVYDSIRKELNQLKVTKQRQRLQSLVEDAPPMIVTPEQNKSQPPIVPVENKQEKTTVSI